MRVVFGGEELPFNIKGTFLPTSNSDLGIFDSYNQISGLSQNVGPMRFQNWCGSGFQKKDPDLHIFGFKDLV